MKKFTFGTPEELVPSRFCEAFNYVETDVKYPASNFSFKKLSSGCVVEFPIEDDCHIYGFGLQLKQFDHRGRKLRLDVNADPVSGDGETHAPVPFFVGWRESNPLRFGSPTFPACFALIFEIPRIPANS